MGDNIGDPNERCATGHQSDCQLLILAQAVGRIKPADFSEEFGREQWQQRGHGRGEQFGKRDGTGACNGGVSIAIVRDNTSGTVDRHGISENDFLKSKSSCYLIQGCQGAGGKKVIGVDELDVLSRRLA
nr:hypothetical protein [uncultured Sphingomonas sp.]